MTQTTQQSTQWIYRFGDGTADGNASMKNTLGGKGAGLAEMSKLGLPVPPGFTISTNACQEFHNNNQQLPNNLVPQIHDALQWLGKSLNSKFGDPKQPLLVSVRSGAPASMPGMMDTILNLGLNQTTALALAKQSKNPRFAWDCFRRFIHMHGNVALNVPHHIFEETLDNLKQQHNAPSDADLNSQQLQTLSSQYLDIIRSHTQKDFPNNPNDQLVDAVRAVFNSWNNPRAKTYRRLHNIPSSWGTAVNIQAMVFGNMGENSATGVAFTRNPSTGENSFYGEYLPNAQGEDVVAGIRTPLPLAKPTGKSSQISLQELMPDAFNELLRMRSVLENRYKDMQDMEFTIERGKLWLLQTRSGKRTTQAALRIAVEMTEENLISKKLAVQRVNPASLDQILHPTLDPNAQNTTIASGLPASPGAASGYVAFSPEEAENLQQQGKHAVLVRTETSPEDIHGMHAAQGILTARGGMTSHAAVVARGMGKPCVSGASSIRIDQQNLSFSTNDGYVVKHGDVITIDGSSGRVILGDAPRIPAVVSKHFASLMAWADQFRRLNVRANAETPDDANVARRFGAQGIGLCRTEHMFFDAQRINTVRAMILAQNKPQRQKALDALLPLQQNDFLQLFLIMDDLPVTIRLLDPPLHEFLPNENDIPQLARELNAEPSAVKRRISQLHETNPMLGHRGCRLAITFPEIYKMQALAVFRAMKDAKNKTGKNPQAEIMIPLVSMSEELKFILPIIHQAADETFPDHNSRPQWSLGAMIELPRAALRADEIAKHAEFFSFGTNDLTQTTFGLSRDDASSFLSHYAEHNILPLDPFVSLDEKGVGELVQIAVERGRRTRPDLKTGICGEHGGDPQSVFLCEKYGLDYVSCSPYRIPIARLAAAQAAINSQQSHDDPNHNDPKPS